MIDPHIQATMQAMADGGFRLPDPLEATSLRAMLDTPIPVPPMEEQERIVAILDKFDALVNDLTSGLPAEIAARRQQHEHYRDRLLTFKEAA